MKKAILFSTLAATTLCGLSSCGGASAAKLETTMDSVSYALGALQGDGMKNQFKQMAETDSIIFNSEELLSGFETSFVGDTAALKIKLNEAEGLMQAFSMEMQMTPDSVTSDMSKVSYAYGALMGNDMKQNFQRMAEEDSIAFDNNILFESFAIALNGDTATLQFDIEKANGVMEKFSTEMQAQMVAKQEAEAAKNIAAGGEFLAAKEKEEGVVKTESGLLYKVVEQGKGAKATATDNVTVHYKGTLMDGTVFDSSYDRGEPTSFGVTQVIPGWTEALQLMNPGSKYELYIPANLGYGPQPIAGQPYAVLVFEVELISIDK